MNPHCCPRRAEVFTCEDCEPDSKSFWPPFFVYGNGHNFAQSPSSEAPEPNDCHVYPMGSSNVEVGTFTLQQIKDPQEHIHATGQN